MRLTKIKLSGFKSFVDPTTVIVPSNLVGIVGPNGCGKSNIIDAITWVMGESSAKHLRGDSLSDVIFNGSSTRQPVGQATVELEFDNSEGRLGGQYASYNEISIKRQMTRDGISNYYLNGSRCRRRDIQAIFLGTGLGPRSYAIIEQGVISRLIEAKPDELRFFIEEAAGISKYRERRRETENRMRHTKDNIDRLNDIREELNKQLLTLRRQSRAAERYQILKQEERRAKSELLAINWRDLQQQAGLKAERVRQEETRVEQGMAELRSIESRIENFRNQLVDANEKLNAAQSSYYQTGGEIAHIEQNIQHARERRTSLQEDLKKLHDAASSFLKQQQADKTRLEKLSDEAQRLQPRISGTRSESEKAYDTLGQAEKAMQEWQTEWDSCNEMIAGFNRQIDVDSTLLEHLTSNLNDADERKTVLEQELNDVNSEDLKLRLEETSQVRTELESAVKKKRKELERKQSEILTLRKQVNEINEALAVERSEHQKLEGRIASLESMQSQAGGIDQNTVIEWLDSINLKSTPRLVTQLDVEKEWTLALEMVLSFRLQDIVVDDLQVLLDNLDRLKSGQLALITTRAFDQEKEQKARFEDLQSKIRSKISLAGCLAGIYVAEDIKTALKIHKQLQEGESVITKDGIWLGKEWVRINRGHDRESGILRREQLLGELKDQNSTLLSNITLLEKNLETALESLSNTENDVAAAQKDLHPSLDELAEIQSNQAEIKTRLEQSEKRISQIRAELEDLDDQIELDTVESESIQHRLQRTEKDRNELAKQREKLNMLRERHRKSLDSARTQWQASHEQSHEIALQLESISSQRASLEQAIERIDLQLKNQNGRINEINRALESSTQPLASMEKSLAGKLKEKVNAEKKLAEARACVQEIDASVRNTEQERAASEQKIQELRSELETARMQAQETRVRLDTVSEQIQETGQKVEEILVNLDEEAERNTWQQKIADIEKKIHRLGPINLAAIDEFNQLSERKEYLDRQHADLSEALKTLDNAIRKIDRETRTRFKETFDDLNTNLKTMFPLLFGGGHAYLEMIGMDLLETGVTILAQPPGKKLSTIHLLSGGEKALTAVTLVFAIFKLNPAPFCILDEVDAPLDDTNVGRFSELLLQMSKDVQFIFITHNKITMEIARQLMGVTMYEAGVSRLVSVDVDEAVQLAESA